MKDTTPIQDLIERTVTNGTGYITLDPSKDWTRPLSESYLPGELVSVTKEMDTLDLQCYLGHQQTRTINVDDPSTLREAHSLLSDLKMIEALKLERGERVYYTTSEVMTSIAQARLAITEIPHPLESNPLFRDCIADPRFREWCAAGFDPMMYYG